MTAAIASWSSAARTTASTRISDGKRSFLTSAALSVIAVAERMTPSLHRRPGQQAAEEEDGEMAGARPDRA